MKQFLLLIVLAWSGFTIDIANAEGGSCPPGYYPVGGGGSQGCAPLPAAGGSSGGDSYIPPDPGPRWADRWGAVAGGGGQFGSANNMSSKRKANKVAVAECKSRGGGKACKILMTYSNQCGAMAWGDNFGITFRSPELPDAKQNAMERCQAKTKNCEVAFAACSYPVRVR